MRALNKVLSAVATTVGVAAASNAYGVTVYSTGFESPTYTSGSSLLGTDGWSTAIPPFLNPDAAKISTAGPKTGTQHVRVLGTALASAAEVAPDDDAVGSYRRPLSYDAGAAGLPIVTLEADVRLNSAVINGTSAGPNYLGPDTLDANIAARSNDGGVGELGISSDGYLYAYSNASSNPVFVRPTTLNTYHHLAIQVNVTADTYAYFVDGTAMGTPIAFDAGFTSDVLLRGALVTYARGTPADRANASYDFDNFTVTATPEPAALTAVLATSSLFGRRRRKM